MKKGGQLNKSRNHEREVAELFTKAVYPDGDGEFRRVPMSGGWDKKVVTGDIIPFRMSSTTDMIADRNFPFSIECKNWRKDNVNFLFSGLYTNESIIYEWMKQATDDCAHLLHKKPMVIFKFRKENVVMITHSVYGFLAGLFGHTNLRFYRIQIWDGRGKEEDLHFFLLKDFLEWIDWGCFK